ncbi:fatty acyl-CoA reductase 3-like [Spinacia oleracea]|uniref:Fatty acyl-CoA reductase n=1 Tax=Spinacia oleracea TaxID=3562 RepID=A0ABM3R3A3_SPIOL|nr:fatty acyl-CoA reductase 3-like [Spinacia oleracea]
MGSCLSKHDLNSQIDLVIEILKRPGEVLPVCASQGVFKVVREKWGANFESFVSDKITVVAGDTSYENLGLTVDQLKEMHKDIDVVINVAATTKFDERYDVALGVNTLGAKNVVNFAKNCSRIQFVRVHLFGMNFCKEN